MGRKVASKPDIHWDTVHAVLDWYDGPRLGIADYLGQPHLFESRWDSLKGGWEGEVSDEECYTYQCWLRPINPEEFRLAMEDWAIWERWGAAFAAGVTDESTHPALPEERVRHEQIQSALDGALEPGQPNSFPALGRFESNVVNWAQPSTLQVPTPERS